MATARLRVDRADVRETPDELTLILGHAGVHVLLIQLRYDGWIEHLINSAGATTHGPGAWTLIDHELTLELSPRSAATIGFPPDCRLHLDVDDATISVVRAALLEILQCACYVVDTPEGRVTS